MLIIALIRNNIKHPDPSLLLKNPDHSANIFIDHFKLTFVAAKPPPSHVFEQVALAASEGSGEYF